MNLSDRQEYIFLTVLLGIVGLVLIATTIRGPFIIDEINYMVTVVGLREGRLTVPGTEGLPPSKELFAFDPEPFGRVAARTPVASLAPPLYAPFALPFSFLGWRGLVFLNILSFLLTIYLVFHFAKGWAVDRQTPWLAAALVLLGGYGIEYAQGVWPHMFSVFLVTAAALAASRVWQGGSGGLALLSGFLIGIAVGVREQNIILVGCLGLTILLFSTKRLARTAFYALGASVPLVIAGAMNFARDHLWHPFPKFVAYSQQVVQSTSGKSVFTPLRIFWAKFVDFSTHPGITYPFESDIYRKNPESGAYLVLGTLKKALVQSSPWIGLAFAVLLVVWFKRVNGRADSQVRLQALSLLVFPLVVMFSLVGTGRTDGLAYNQRYFLEMIPLAALAVVIALDGLKIGTIQMVGGFLAAGIAYAVTLMLPSHSYYEIVLTKLPLLLALLLIAVWLGRKRAWAHKLLSISLGLCIGWAFFIHVLDDLPASRARRAKSAVQLSSLEAIIPTHSAVFAYRGTRDVAGPLLLTRDVVLLDAGADEGADAARLAAELRQQRRRIFILPHFFPQDILRGIIGSGSIRFVQLGSLQVDEAVSKSPAENGHAPRDGATHVPTGSPSDEQGAK